MKNNLLQKFSSVIFVCALLSAFSSEIFAQTTKPSERPEEALYNSGVAYLEKKEYDKAIAEYSKAIKINPRYADAYNDRGYVYYLKKDYDKAIADLSKAIILSPEFLTAYYNRREAYLAVGKNDLAEADAKIITDLENKLARIKNDKAVDDFSKAIQTNPQDSEAYYNRGNLYLEMKDYDKAIADFSKTIEINPQYSEAYNDRGYTYYLKKDYDKAIADYSKAININPKFLKPYYNRKEAYQAIDKNDLAYADAKKIKELEYIEPDYSKELYPVIFGVAFSPDGKFIAARTHLLTTVWSLEAGQLTKSFRDDDNGNKNNVIFLPGGKSIAYGTYEGAKFWNLETGLLIKTLDTESSELTLSADGKTAASSVGYNSISLLDVETGQRIKSFETPYIIRPALSPDGKIIAYGGSNAALKLLNVETGKEIKSLQTGVINPTAEDQANAVIGVVFSPDGKTLASQAETLIKLWNVETGRELKSLTGHTDVIFSTAFSPDGKTIASGSTDKTIKLWNVETGTLIKTLECGDVVMSVAFSPDGRFLVSGCAEKGIRLWDTQSYKLLATLLPIHKTDWVVKDENGHYDASKGALENKKYLILPDAKYTPGLLQKIYANQPLTTVAPR